MSSRPPISRKWNHERDNILPPRRSRRAARERQARRKYIAVDFTVPSSLQRFLDALAARERIDVCVNNAGINRLNPVDEIRDDDWAAMRAVNLDAPLLITRSVAPIMKRRRYGRIVNISSIWGVIGKARRGAYAITKFGLQGLTVSSALELAPYNILVNAVSPGFVMTELTTRNLGAEEMEALARQVPLGRFAQPERSHASSCSWPAASRRTSPGRTSSSTADL